MSVTTDFAARLKELREISGYSQAQLAEKLGISRGSISYYENGERTPDIEVLDKITLLFGVSTDYMLGYIDTINKKNEDIGFRLGLTDKAIDSIENAYYDVKILSRIIENDKFVGLMHTISSFLRDKNESADIYELIEGLDISEDNKRHLVFYFDNCDFDTSWPLAGRANILRFQCVIIFEKILDDLYSHAPGKKYTKEEIETIEQKYQIALKEYREMQEESKRNYEKDLKKYQEECAGEIQARKAIYLANNGLK